MVWSSSSSCYAGMLAVYAAGLLLTWNGRSNGAWLSYLKAIWPEWNEKQESINSLGVQFAPWAEALKRTNHVGSGHWKTNCERPALACPGAVQCDGATWRIHDWVRNSSFKPSHLHFAIALHFPSFHRFAIHFSKSRSAWTVENASSPPRTTAKLIDWHQSLISTLSPLTLSLSLLPSTC